MVVSLDTNILVALWYDDDLNRKLAETLDLLNTSDTLLICAPVYAEILGAPKRKASLDDLLQDTGIKVDWEMSEPVWRAAALAYQGYAMRRKATGSDHPRRILTDFLIGAHAFVNGCTLFTLDQRHYRAAFPRLKLQRF